MHHGMSPSGSGGKASTPPSLCSGPQGLPHDPALCLGLLLFVFQWESFLWPLIAAPSPDLHLIQVVLARFSTEYAPIWNQQFAASTIAGLLPLIFIYLFQKQFVSALTGVEQK